MGSPYGFELVENCVICKLRSDSFFCSLPKAALEAFDKIKYTASYPAGAVLFVEGQAPRGIYMLCKGRVKMSTTSAEGKTLILKIAQPGEVLGMHATVSGTPYEITAETGQPCQLNFIKRDDFLRFLQDHGDACLKAAQHLSKDCQSAYQQIRSLGLSHSAPERLARLLLEWTATSPDKTRAQGEAGADPRRDRPDHRHIAGDRHPRTCRFPQATDCRPQRFYSHHSQQGRSGKTRRRLEPPAAHPNLPVSLCRASNPAISRLILIQQLWVTTCSACSASLLVDVCSH